MTLLRNTWSDLQHKLGTNQPQCYLLCDNLNNPGIIAREFTKLAGRTPWAGVSHFWSIDLPFDATLMSQLARDRRGVGMLAICGKVHTQLAMSRDLPGIPVPRSGDQKDKARFEKDREGMAARAAELLRQMPVPPKTPDHALFVVQPKATFASRVLAGEIEQKTHDWAEFFQTFGEMPSDSIGQGLTYCNGGTLTNALVVLQMSGSLPLRMDSMSLMQRMTERRLISHEISRPITDLANSFGPHPLQGLADLLGPDLIHLLQQADRVEVFRIQPNTPEGWSKAGHPAIQGHEIIARGKPQGPEFAKGIAAALLNEKSSFGFMSTCIFSPRDALRMWRGKECATLLVCFECEVVQIKHYDAAGRVVLDTGFDFGKNHEFLASLLRQAFPSTTTPKKRGPAK